ncbi:TonB-dependent receptor plug domain-containing protein [Hyphococcus luteus]|uniref:TonB-dependent receptor n=1 Tax=Hyphococcus luteus TaxID=2058213 RepID=A0A2S7K558_9PROT|nr:TonB-dependent receptor [Marinicaulis flavus]PQA87645.1 hypothetical protein CW354_11250 [Marinicaulis flavus]
MQGSNHYRTLRSQRRLSLLLGSASAVSIIALTPVYAQDDESDENRDVVTVTGTRIQGIDPVGSEVLTVGGDDIAKSRYSSTADLLRKVPQVLSFGGNEGRAGGAGFQGDVVNVSYANSPNLRGLGTAATLSLVNGHRTPAVGPNSDIFEPDTVPSIALSQIQIVADGASAIYGSDAVTGVMNYIMREPFDGAQVSGRVGFADDHMDWKAAVMLGKTWDTGGIMVAYEHIDREALAASDRPKLYNDDFSEYGGDGLSLATAPGNILTPSGYMGIPAGSSTTLTLSDLLASPNTQSRWTNTDALPAIDSNSFVAKFNQELAPGFELYGDGIFYRRNITIRQTPYDTLAGPLVVPVTNPYHPCNNGGSANGITCPDPVTVQYNFFGDLGPHLRDGYEQTWNGTAGFRFDLPMPDWTGDVYFSYGKAKNSVRTDDGGTARGTLPNVLAGDFGAIPAFNPFCDGTPGCNDQATLDYLDSWSTTNYWFKRKMVSGSFTGPLFSITGGDVRLAIGGEHYRDRFDSFNISGASQVVTEGVHSLNGRNVSAAFGELYVPLVGDANSMPGIVSLELTAAGRYENYSDFGDSLNPKFGVNWEPFEDFVIHASFGKSFRAPVLSSNNPNAQAGTYTRFPIDTMLIDPSLGYMGAPGFTTPTYIIGGNGTLGPEKAKTYSAGFEWTPSDVDGLTLSMNYYRIDYTGKIDYPAFNVGPLAALNTPSLSPFVFLNPGAFSTSTLSQAEFDALIDALNNGTAQPAFSPYDTVDRLTIGPAPSPGPGGTIAIIDARRNNIGVVKTSGLDFTAYYNFAAQNIDWTVGAVATYVLKYDEAIAPGAPIEDRVNYFGGPLKFAARGEVTADLGEVQTSLYLNFANAYHIERRFIPAAAPDEYLDIDAFATLDFSITYSPDATGLLNGLDMTFSVENVFDSDPPLVLNATGGANFPGLQYDNSRNSPLGRVLSIQISKAF